MAKRLMSWAENTGLTNCQKSKEGLGNISRQMTSSLSLPNPFARHNDCIGAWGAIFLDIEKAFDRVWHNGFRYELLQMNAPALLLRWISSFLRNRTVKVRILGHTSKEIAINYGVHQGSPISPLFFLLCMSKLHKLPNTRRSLFADDLMIYSESLYHSI